MNNIFYHCIFDEAGNKEIEIHKERGKLFTVHCHKLSCFSDMNDYQIKMLIYEHSEKELEKFDKAYSEWIFDFSNIQEKCENCIFCTPTPKNMALPNDFICGSFHSKWLGYWPINGCCEHFSAPTGKTVEEFLKDDEQARKVIDCMLTMMSGIWNKDFLKGFMKQDAAVLSDYGIGENK